MTELFKLDIKAQGTAKPGYIAVTSPADRVYLLTFSSPPDNRLTTVVIQTFMLALDILESRYPVGVVITTSAIPKFYSNGLDLDHLRDTPDFRDVSLYPLMRRLVTYPMPTIALINGHAFAGGMIVATCHDYRIMNPNKGYLCMNEVDFGFLMDTPLIHIFKEKVTPLAFRDLILGSHRFAAKEALERGLVDGLGGLDEALQFAKERNLVKKGESKVYAGTKQDMYRDVLRYLDSDGENHKWRAGINAAHDEASTRSKRKVEAWEKGGSVAKL